MKKKEMHIKPYRIADQRKTEAERIHLAAEIRRAFWGCKRENCPTCIISAEGGRGACDVWDEAARCYLRRHGISAERTKYDITL